MGSRSNRPPRVRWSPSRPDPLRWPNRPAPLPLVGGGQGRRGDDLAAVAWDCALHLLAGAALAALIYGLSKAMEAFL